MTKIGYCRVSSKDQNLDRQIIELEKYECEKIFTDKVSGKDFNRSGYNELKEYIREGDELVLHDLSRFGRNKKEIMEEWKHYSDNNIDITVLNMPILNTKQYKEVDGLGKVISDIVLAVLSWNVEDERNRIKQAQKEGIEIAKEKGKYKGRPKKYSPYAKNAQDRLIYETIINMKQQGETVSDISRKTGVTRATIYKLIKEK